MKIKVFNNENDHLGSFKFFNDAALFVSALGEDATIRTSKSEKSVLWTQGKDKVAADKIAEVCRNKLQTKANAAIERAKKKAEKLDIEG